MASNIGAYIVTTCTVPGEGRHNPSPLLPLPVHRGDFTCRELYKEGEGKHCASGAETGVVRAQVAACGVRRSARHVQRPFCVRGSLM